MLGGLYGSVYLQVRKIFSPSARTFWLALLLFVLVRGLTDTEPFDLSLPLWTIVLITVLIKSDQAVEANESPVNLGAQFNIAITHGALPSNQ